MTRKKILSPLLSLLTMLLPYGLTAQWNPDAGLVPGLLEKATVTVSSGTINKVITGGYTGYRWESTDPLPGNYLARPDQNLLLHRASYTVVPTGSIPAQALDGNANTAGQITTASVAIHLTDPVKALWLHLKYQIKDSLFVDLIYDQGMMSLVFLPATNYQLQAIRPDSSLRLKAIRLRSARAWDLFALALMNRPPEESVTFDLGHLQPIGWISTRHYNGQGVKQIRVEASADGRQWTTLFHPSPGVTAVVPVLLNPAFEAQYLRVTFTLLPEPWQKALLMDIAAYGPEGPYGPKPAAKPSSRTWSDAMGINGFWGWGFNVYSDLLLPGQGPQQFRQVASQVRNYHPVDWDIDTPGARPHWETSLSSSDNGMKIDWLREYSLWKQDGLTIDITLSLNKQRFGPDAWHQITGEGCEYGRSLVKYLMADGLIHSVEVGNEPWNYDLQQYTGLLTGMTEGIREADKSVLIFPCATQAWDPLSEDRNYIGNYLNQRTAAQVDGLNTHVYNYVFLPDGTRHAVRPEDPRAGLWSVNNMLRFRDHNMPGKPLWVTEFGYDSDGGGEPCTHSECLSEFDQACYGTRMALILYRLGVDRFYWYFFANTTDGSGLHNRSGLTTSAAAGFHEKASFQAFTRLQKQLGPLHLDHVIAENNDLWAYAFADESGTVVRIIAWWPFGATTGQTHWVDLPLDQSVTGAEVLVSGEQNQSSSSVSYTRQVKVLRIALSGNPVILTLTD